MRQSLLHDMDETDGEEREREREGQTNKSKGRFDPIDSTTQITGINRTALWLLIATRARNRVHPGYKRDETHAAPGGIRTSKTNVIKAIARRGVSAFSSLPLPLLLSLHERDCATIAQDNLNNHRLQGKRDSLMAGNPFVKTVVTSSTSVARGGPLSLLLLLLPTSIDFGY